MLRILISGTLSGDVWEECPLDLAQWNLLGTVGEKNYAIQSNISAAVISERISISKVLTFSINERIYLVLTCLCRKELSLGVYKDTNVS